MKYAFMTFSTPQLSLPETLRLARELGYDGIEPRVGRSHAHGIEPERTAVERAEIRRQAEDANIALCCLALSEKFCAADAAPVVAETLRHLELAHDIGCPLLRVFGGAPPVGMAWPEAIDRTAQALSAVAPAAAKAGVALCLETHDSWTNPADVAAVMRQVDHPAVAVNWDILHPCRRSQVPMDEAFASLRPWIRHVHVHDGTLNSSLEIKPCGQGQLDIAAAFSCLIGMNYDGFLSGEWINCEGTINLRDEIGSFRALEASLREGDPEN